MATPSRHREGLAIVRVSLEDEHPAPLRARVTTIEDVAGATGEPVAWVGSDRDAVLAHVRRWLDRWLAGS